MMKTNSFFRRYDITAPFKAPKSTEHMTRIVLAGSFLVTILINILLLFSMIALGHTYVLHRIIIGAIVLFYLVLVGFFISKKYLRLSAWMLIVLYGLIGILILHIWGINAPIGILILGFVIFLAGVMLGSRYILVVTIGIIATLTLLQFFNVVGLSQPDHSLLDNDSSYGDVAGYSVIFAIFAVISWLSGTKMETTLKRAIKAESALEKERDELAIRVEEQTKHLIDAQQKELKQLYRFAELGQLTTIILHELANHLSVLTLDIDDLKDRHQNSIAIKHAKESIFYIDTIIDQVRNQINDSENVKKFDALITIKESLGVLREKLDNPSIKLHIDRNIKRDRYVFGDPLRLSQAITILVTNAVQADSTKQSPILVDVSSTKSSVRVSVKDFGTGISKEARRSLFQQQKSHKSSGLGIGLYITKQIIDTHFKGKIWLSPAMEYTQFNIEIPKTKRQ